MDEIERIRREITANEDRLLYHRNECKRLEQEIQYARERLADAIMPWNEVVEIATDAIAGMDFPCRIRADRATRDICLVVEGDWLGEDEGKMSLVTHAHIAFVRTLAEKLPGDVFRIIKCPLDLSESKDPSIDAGD